MFKELIKKATSYSVAYPIDYGYKRDLEIQFCIYKGYKVFTSCNRMHILTTWDLEEVEKLLMV